MMKDKDIKKLLKSEGSQLAPSSFSSLKEKLFKSDKYLATQMNKEGEQFVPNNYPPIKDEVMTISEQKEEKKAKFSTPWKVGLCSSLVALTACAIIIPIVSIEASKPLTADATCTVELDDKYKMTCDLNKDGSIKLGSINADTQLAKKLLAGIIAKNFEVRKDNFINYISDIFTFGFTTKDKENNYVIPLDQISGKLTITTFGEGRFKDFFISNLKEKLISTDIKEVTYKYVNEVTNEFEAIKYQINYYFNKLFSRNSTIISNFANKDQFDVSTLAKARIALKILRNIYGHIALDSDIESFQDDLINLQGENNETLSNIDYSNNYKDKPYWNENYWLEYWRK